MQDADGSRGFIRNSYLFNRSGRFEGVLPGLRADFEAMGSEAAAEGETARIPAASGCGFILCDWVISRTVFPNSGRTTRVSTHWAFLQNLARLDPPPFTPLALEVSLNRFRVSVRVGAQLEAGGKTDSSNASGPSRRDESLLICRWDSAPGRSTP